MTMDLLGLKQEDLIDGLEEPIGAATALLEMKTAAIQLFDQLDTLPGVAERADPPTEAHGVPFGEAFRFWLKLGFISFGGPAGQIAVMHRELVEQRRWISDRRFLHALNYCMLLPGPEAQQLATYVGWLLHRTLGGLVAGTLFVLPGAALILALSWVYAEHGSIAWVAATFHGLRAAVIAIVALAVIRIGSKALKSAPLWWIAAASFVAIFLFKVPFPAIVVGAGVVGLIGGRWRPRAFARSSRHHGEAEPAALLDDDEPPPEHARPTLARLVRCAAIGLAAWLGPLALVAWWRGRADVLTQEAIFFSKCALVTFGGAYAVLAYISQAAVERFGWLLAPQMLDGLGLAETTPGPLILVTQFVGFLGAHGQPAASRRSRWASSARSSRGPRSRPASYGSSRALRGSSGCAGRKLAEGAHGDHRVRRRRHREPRGDVRRAHAVRTGARGRHVRRHGPGAGLVISRRVRADRGRRVVRRPVAVPLEDPAGDRRERPGRADRQRRAAVRRSRRPRRRGARDVEPDVVDPGTGEAAGDLRDEPFPLVVGHPLDVVAQADRGEVRLDVIGIEFGRLVVEPRLDVGEPRPLQPRPRRVRGGEVLAALEALAQLTQRRLDRRDVARATALRRRAARPVAGPPRGSRTARRDRGSNGTWPSTGSRRPVGPPGIGPERSATTYPTRSPNGERRVRACCTIALEPSTATTRPRGSRSTSRSVTRPVPQPASITRSSPWSSSRPTTASPHRVIGDAKRSYVTASHSRLTTARLPERQRSSSSRRMSSSSGTTTSRCSASGITTSIPASGMTSGSRPEMCSSRSDLPTGLVRERQALGTLLHRAGLVSRVVHPQSLRPRTADLREVLLLDRGDDSAVDRDPERRVRTIRPARIAVRDRVGHRLRCRRR